MIKYSFLVIIFFTVINNSIAQINIDSLRNEMESYSKDAQEDEFGYSYVTYSKDDASIKYVFTLNNDSLTEDLWGNALVVKEFDSLKRSIGIFSYSLNGEFNPNDPVPIAKTSYITEFLTRTDYFTKDYLFESRVEVLKDEKGREIEFTGYDANLKLTTRQTTEFLDAENVSLKRFYDENNQLISDDCGVAVRYKKMDSEDPNFIVEEQFLDKKMNQVNCTDLGAGIGEKAYSRVTYTKENDKIKVQYFAKNGKLVEWYRVNSPKSY